LSATTAPPASAGTGQPADPAARPDDRLRRARWPIAVAGFVVLVTVISLLLAPTGNGADLDPESATPGGSRAVAQILQRQGVVVTRVTRAADLQDRVVPGTTLLVTRSDFLAPARLQQIADLGADLVLVEPDAVTLTLLAPRLLPAGVVGRRDADPGPGCRASEATAAGRAVAGGNLYRENTATALGGFSLCYPDPGSPGSGSFATGQQDGYRVAVIGQSAVLTNADLARQGDAALALRTLGANWSLVWYLPDPLDAGNAGPSLRELRPRWWSWLLWQLLLAAGVTMLWRGRRLGRLVPEPLPVVVRASETEEGRARLYRASRARGRAAATLRTAALRRLARRLDAPAEATPGGVVRMVAASTGRSEPDVAGVLLGPAPQDDGALVWLADQLDALEAALADPGARPLPAAPATGSTPAPPAPLSASADPTREAPQP
jgi:hypothetical protein